jgi:hypothetical protein
MSTKLLTTRGREVMAGSMAALPFVAALSAGEPAWDAAWDLPNPPEPSLDVLNVIDLVGYVRPTIVGFVTPDPDGLIVTDEGGTYSNSEERTRFLRVRISVPAGSFTGVRIREVGIFANVEYAPGVPSGRTVLLPGDVVSPGDLFQLVWSPPQFIDAGTSYARNFILRV